MTSTTSLFPNPVTELRSWRNWHKGEIIVVCGLGQSVEEFAPYAKYFVTIGVNDIGRHFDPDYLLVVDAIGQFRRPRAKRADRDRYIVQTKAAAVFTQLGMGPLGFEPKRKVRISLARQTPPKIDHPNTLPCTNNTPYIALALAAYMGAERIGVVGVDLVGHSFEKQASAISTDFMKLRTVIEAAGTKIVNLSRISLVKTLPQGKVEDLLPQKLIEHLKRKEQP